MALRDQAKNRKGTTSSSGTLATKARNRKPSMKVTEPDAGSPQEMSVPNAPPSPPPLPPALGFISSYSRIPGLRKDKSSGI
jgi:hypothetical protein